MSPRVFGAPLHLLTGKGGVGKTTLAAALAIEARRRGGRPIVVELGHRASLARALGSERAIGHAPVELLPGIFATNVDLDQALLDHLAKRIRSRRAARRLLGSSGLRGFFEAAPAVSELLTLERIEQLMADFDPVIVDLDATGHALMFLELPRLLAAIAPAGPIGELVRALGALLLDRARTRVHAVTLLAPLPIEETRELTAHLTALGAPLGSLFVNRVRDRAYPRADEEDLDAVIERVRAQAPSSGVMSALTELRDAGEVHDAARAALSELVSARAHELRAIELPELTVPADGVPADGAPADGELDLRGLAELGALAAEGWT